MLGLRVLLWQSDGLEEKALLPQYLVHGNDGPTSQTDFFVDSLLGERNYVFTRRTGQSSPDRVRSYSSATGLCATTACRSVCPTRKLHKRSGTGSAPRTR